MTLGSLFDGIGGFQLAATRYGIEPLWASEIDASCVSITKRHFPAMLHLGDVTKINGAGIPPVDIVTFGSPCQDLSQAGNSLGLAGKRSGLFAEAIRIIDEMKEATNGRNPAIAIWENVTGAYTCHDGMDFKSVLESFAKRDVPMPDTRRWAGAGMVRGGAADIAWRTYDAQFWGVPQKRRRIYLVADFRGRRASKILFESTRIRQASGEARRGDIGTTADEIYSIDNRYLTYKGRQRISAGIAYTIVASQPAWIWRDGIFRQLTPLECERLQGFPDGWTALGVDNENICDAKRWKALGNSVAIPCVEHIMSNIANCLKKRSNDA